MVEVFIPASIKDPDLRRVLAEIARNAPGGTRSTGTGSGASVTVQAANPTASTEGNTGDVIYSTTNDSIWVYNGTAWDQASSGQSGVTAVIEVLEATNASPNWSTFANTRESSQDFKNDSAAVKGLRIVVYEGGDEVSASTYTDSGTTYQWRKNGVHTFTPNATQVSGVTGTTERVLLINQDDVRDGNFNEVFACQISY